MSVYGVDLGDLWRGSLSVSRAGRLAFQLPPGSRVASALGEDGAWSVGEQIAAHIADTLAWANYQRAGGKGQKPKPLPRPADIHERRLTEARNEALAVEARRRQRRRRPQQL